jgi:broad specificity phosphatase PhoE
MLKHTIYFQDLKADTQAEVWQAVQNELLASGEVEYRGEDESEEEFATRLEEAVDDYINRHNFAIEFSL